MGEFGTNAVCSTHVGPFIETARTVIDYARSRFGHPSRHYTTQQRHYYHVSKMSMACLLRVAPTGDTVPVSGSFLIFGLYLGKCSRLYLVYTNNILFEVTALYP